MVPFVNVRRFVSFALEQYTPTACRLVDANDTLLRRPICLSKPPYLHRATPLVISLGPPLCQIWTKGSLVAVYSCWMLGVCLQSLSAIFGSFYCM
ncbi:hypothetical protein RB195_022662 [Necator americanus]|uniref:Uncharacterized protein n=1 Tax=Necator americanus TaxID=51031 RepID=A0ABR1EG44_NECAM